MNDTPIGPQAARRWPNGSRIRYYFYTQPSYRCARPADRNVFEAALAAWTQRGSSLWFEETRNANEAQVRLLFNSTYGRWSSVGRDALGISDPRYQHEFDPVLITGGMRALAEMGHLASC